MESLDAGDGVRQADAPPPAAPADVSQPATEREAGTRSWCKPAPHKRSTKGGSGSTAGATPKKAYRPSVSSRPRPAGKKPDHGRG